MLSIHTKPAVQFSTAAFLLTFAAGIVTPVRAEGSMPFDGAFGVNRVIRTKSTGYIEVEGDVIVSATLPNPDTDAAAKDHENRPNPYLGGRVGGAEYDGGLMWEPDPVTINGATYDTGWSAFLLGDGLAVSPRILISGKSIPWRYSIGQTRTSASISSKLRLTFRADGKVSLYVSAMPHGGTFFLHKGVIDAEPAQPAKAATATTAAIPAKAAVNITPTQSQGGVTFTNAQRSSANVKRVAALTRAGSPIIYAISFLTGTGSKKFHDELDGSVVTITWKNVQVRKKGKGQSLRNWVSSDVNQSATGYDGKPDNDFAKRDWDRRVSYGVGVPSISRTGTGVFLSRKTVSFPNLEQNLPNHPKGIGRRPGANSASATEKTTPLFPAPVSVSRYTQETVRISLRTATSPVGIGGF